MCRVGEPVANVVSVSKRMSLSICLRRIRGRGRRAVKEVSGLCIVLHAMMHAVLVVVVSQWEKCGVGAQDGPGRLCRAFLLTLLKERSGRDGCPKQRRPRKRRTIVLFAGGWSEERVRFGPRSDSSIAEDESGLRCMMDVEGEGGRRGRGSVQIRVELVGVCV